MRGHLYERLHDHEAESPIASGNGYIIRRMKLKKREILDRIKRDGVIKGRGKR